MPIKPEALLFDLGGVLIDIDFSRALQSWAPLSALPMAQLQRAFVFDAAYERHERGEIGADAYFAHLRETLQLSGSDAQIEAGWNAIFLGEIASTRALVQRARQTLPCHGFSNTNACHMAHWSALCPGVVASLDRIFVSHQMGLRKPEQAAFDAVCDALELRPASILFFDDTASNVQGALDAGLQAVLERGPGDVADALRAAGIA